MPFTGSHPAAVLPLLGTRLPAAALVVGSVAPDLPYYLPGRPGWVTHTAAAVVSTDLLIGLGAWLVWVVVAAAPVRAVAPRDVAVRLAPPAPLRNRLGSPARVVGVLVALVVGAATHVGWDAFTHPGRFGDRHVTWLATTHHGQPGHQWAQYASSLLGLVVMAVWAARWRVRTAPAFPARSGWRPGRRGWVVIGLAALVAGTVAAVAAAPGAGSARHVAFTAVTSFGGGVGAVAVAAAVLWHGQARRSRRT